MFLLDTNVWSELLRPKPEPTVARRIFSVSPERLFASEITRYELRYGARLRSASPGLWDRIAEVILPLPTWLPIDPEVSTTAADLDAHLTNSGRRVETPDVFIAATALAFDLVLVTRNARHFANVPGLTVENWFPERSSKP